MMVYSPRKRLTISLFIALFIHAFSNYSEAQSVQVQPDIAQKKSSQRYAGKNWTPAKIAQESLARHFFNQQRLRAAGRPVPEAGPITVTDVSDISVIQDNGSIVSPAQPFTLVGRSVLYTPSGGGYTVTSGASSYDTNFGTKLNLAQSPAVQSSNPNAESGDDAYISQPLGFNFSFYGTTYTSVAISSNGFLTFRPASISNALFDEYSTSSGELLVYLQSALPRIAPYWHDLDARPVATTGTTGIYMRTDADKVVITWNNIRDFQNSSTDNGVHRFQTTLFADGRILVNYDQAQLTSTALVGLSGGANSPSAILVDFANPGTVSANAPFAQLFSRTETLDEFNAIQAFYTAHPNQDNYDFIYILLGFDYVLSGGEIAAMALIDACVRLLPGVMGKEASGAEESFSEGLLEYPQYTRPQVFEGRTIPEILTSGDHARVAAWRRAESESLTRSRRPDLWAIRQGLSPPQKPPKDTTTG